MSPVSPAAVQTRARRVARALAQSRQGEMITRLAREIARRAAVDADTADLESQLAEVAHECASETTPPVVVNHAPASGENCAACSFNRAELDELSARRSVAP